MQDSGSHFSTTYEMIFSSKYLFFKGRLKIDFNEIDIFLVSLFIVEGSFSLLSWWSFSSQEARIEDSMQDADDKLHILVEKSFLFKLAHTWRDEVLGEELGKDFVIGRNVFA